MRGNQRGRKLNLKSGLQVLRACDLSEQDAEDIAATEALSSLPKVESGVESKEEKVSRRHVRSLLRLKLLALCRFRQLVIA